MTYRNANSTCCVTISVLETVGKKANDIQLKVSSEKFKLASTLPAKHIYSVVDPYRGTNELSTRILPYVVKASKKEKFLFISR